MTSLPPLQLPPERQAFVERLYTTAEQAGGEIRLVGGVVRNWVLAHEHTLAFDRNQDMDMAVNLPITDFADKARKSGLFVHEIGLSHGSVTITADGQSAHVTQLRCDRDTDGRHARIESTDSWLEDAQRRDFTMNALYLDKAGELFDPIGGRDDLRNWRLRFVGDPARRLAEDHLRLLRALRFLAVYPRLSMPVDECREITKNTALLDNLSAERIAQEMRALMSGSGALSVLRHCHEIGVDRAVFDSAFRSEVLAHPGLDAVWPEFGFAMRLACLFAPGERTRAGHRLKLGRADMRCLTAADKSPETAMLDRLLSENWTQSAYWLKNMACLHALDHDLKRDARLSAERLREIVLFKPQPCPVTGEHIIKRYGLSGAVVGTWLNRLEQCWVDADFHLTTDQLLERMDKDWDKGCDVSTNA